MVIVGVIIYVVLFVSCLAIVSVGKPITADEQEYEDNAQVEFIKEWKMRQSR